MSPLVPHLTQPKSHLLPGPVQLPAGHRLHSCPPPSLIHAAGRGLKTVNQALSLPCLQPCNLDVANMSPIKSSLLGSRRGPVWFALPRPCPQHCTPWPSPYTRSFLRPLFSVTWYTRSLPASESLSWWFPQSSRLVPPLPIGQVPSSLRPSLNTSSAQQNPNMPTSSPHPCPNQVVQISGWGEGVSPADCKEQHPGHWGLSHGLLTAVSLLVHLVRLEPPLEHGSFRGGLCLSHSPRIPEPGAVPSTC